MRSGVGQGCVSDLCWRVDGFYLCRFSSISLQFTSRPVRYRYPGTTTPYQPHVEYTLLCMHAGIATVNGARKQELSFFIRFRTNSSLRQWSLHPIARIGLSYVEHQHDIGHVVLGPVLGMRSSKNVLCLRETPHDVRVSRYLRGHAIRLRL